MRSNGNEHGEVDQLNLCFCFDYRAEDVCLGHFSRSVLFREEISKEFPFSRIAIEKLLEVQGILKS